MNGVVARVAVLHAASGRYAHVVPRIDHQGRLPSGTSMVKGGAGLSLRLSHAPGGGAPRYADSNPMAVVDGHYSTCSGDDTTGGSLARVPANHQSITAFHVFDSQNTILGTKSTVPGGGTNSMVLTARYSAIGGALANDIGNGPIFVTIAGGSDHSVGTNAGCSAISGGENTAGANSVQCAPAAGFRSPMPEDAPWVSQ